MNAPPRLFHRRGFMLGAAAFCAPLLSAKECLPQRTTFIGREKFERIVAKAVRENWRALPMGQRVTMLGLEMVGTPYVGYTLEIDDHVESASANFNGLDCWTFFEIALGLARMIEVPKPAYTPSDLLAEIECTRYRGGVCHGNYLDRIHYLSEWFYDNDARGTIDHVTTRISPTERVRDRKIQEMTVLWKGYRYLRENPSLRAPMAEHEARIARYNFQYIPKTRARSAEPKIQSGDVIGIVTNQHGGFCSHVGLAIRTQDGVCRFMHASKNHKKVVIDDSISAYLAKFKYHAGIIVGRPRPRSETINDSRSYAARLRQNGGA
jgi:hypothetical protein